MAPRRSIQSKPVPSKDDVAAVRRDEETARRWVRLAASGALLKGVKSAPDIVKMAALAAARGGRAE